MTQHSWPTEFPGGITVCDLTGIVVFMNQRAIDTFGKDLTGQSLVECHPEPARTKLLELLKEPRSNAYTIDKKGMRKLIYQSPWYEEGEFKGLVELSLVIPIEMAHFVRG